MNILYIIIFLFIILISFLYRLVRTGTFSLYKKKIFFGLDPNYQKAEKIRVFQVLILFLFLLYHGSIFWGIPNIFIFILITFVISMLMEIVGEKTGIIFGGKYKYNLELTPGPSLFGIPIVIPIAWVMLTYMSYNLFCFLGSYSLDQIINNNTKLFIIPCIMMVLVDSVLDPIAVDEKRWEWNNKGPYYGVPLLNFFGWFMNCFIIWLCFSYFFLPFRRSFNDVETLTYIPGLIFIFIHLAASRPCFERKLKFPGYLAIFLTIIYIGILIYK